MPLALVLSSFGAASRIGGAAQQYVLAAHKIDPVLAPTAMFGRTPAKGARGEPTSPEVFRRMLGDIEADAVFGLVDLILTGQGSLIASTDCTPGFWNNEGQCWSKEFLQSQGHPDGPEGFFKHIEAWRKSGAFAGLRFSQ